MYPSMDWAGGVCLGVSAQGGVCPGGSAQWGVSARGCLSGGVWQTRPCEQNDWQTGVKALPCRNFVAGRKNVEEENEMPNEVLVWEFLFHTGLMPLLCKQNVGFHFVVLIGTHVRLNDISESKNCSDVTSQLHCNGNSQITARGIILRA